MSTKTHDKLPTNIKTIYSSGAPRQLDRDQHAIKTFQQHYGNQVPIHIPRASGRMVNGRVALSTSPK